MDKLKDNHEIAELLINFMYSLGTLVIYLILMIAEPWIMTLLWGWYVTPEIGISSPSILFFFGVNLMFWVLLNAPKQEENTVSKFNNAKNNALKALSILATGWLIQFVF